MCNEKSIWFISYQNVISNGRKIKTVSINSFLFFVCYPEMNTLLRNAEISICVYSHAYRTLFQMIASFLMVNQSIKVVSSEIQRILEIK